MVYALRHQYQDPTGIKSTFYSSRTIRLRGRCVLLLTSEDRCTTT